MIKFPPVPSKKEKSRIRRVDESLIPSSGSWSEVRSALAIHTKTTDLFRTLTYESEERKTMWITTVCPVAIAIAIGLILLFTVNKWLPWLGALWYKARTNVQKGIEEFKKEINPETEQEDRNDA